MKKLAIAVGAILTAAAAAADAQVYYGRAQYDPYLANRGGFVAGSQECWNPRARHFESVRPGEYQDDLDMSRCRVVGDAVYERREWRDAQRECWNPRARHFESVRPGESQDDLDFSHCRILNDGRYERYWR